MVMRNRKLPLSLALLGALFAAGQGVRVSWAAGKQPPLKKAPMSDDPTELYTQGAVFVATGEIDAADKLVKQALAKHGYAHGFHLLQGDVHKARKKYAEAFYEWQWEFLRAGPGSTTGDLAVKRIGQLLQQQRGPEVDEAQLVLDAVMQTVSQPKEAYAKLERIEKDRGKRFALREYMAEALQRGGQYSQAAAMYRELLADDPYFVPGYVQLSVLEQAAGNTAAANELLAKARAIDPDSWRLKPPATPQQ